MFDNTKCIHRTVEIKTKENEKNEKNKQKNLQKIKKHLIFLPFNL